MEHKESLWRLTWPVFVEMLLNILVGNIDQFMLSAHSQEAVAAVGNANQILNLLAILFNVINLSTIILASQYAGSFQKRRVQVVYNLTIVMNIVFSLIVSAVIFLFGADIFRAMHVQKEVMDQTIQYTYVVGGCILFQGLYTGFGAIFKTEKKMKITMVIAMMINVVNVLFNLALINGVGPIPALGALGAGIATSFSRLVGLGCCIVFALKKTNFRLKLSILKPFPHIELRKMLGIGIPSAGENVSYGFSQTIILRIINSFGFLYVTNAKFYSTMFQWVAVLYSSAVSQVAQILVSRAVGAKDFEEANHRTIRTWLYCMGTGGGLALIMYLICRPLIGLFTQDPRTIELVSKVLFVDIFLELGKCTNVCMVRCLQATGDTKFPIVLGIISQWAVAVVGAYIFGVVMGMGLVGVWMAMALDEILRGIFFIIRWKSGAWKKFNLVE